MKIKIVPSMQNVSTEQAPFFSNNKMQCGNSIPVSGEYNIGDIVISNTQEDDIFGWVCIEAGNPGVWNIIGESAEEKIKTYYNVVNFSDTRNSVEIGIDKYNKRNDILEVHYNGLLLVEGVHYNISEDGLRINAIGAAWNQSASDNQEMTFKVYTSNIDLSNCVTKDDLSSRAPAGYGLGDICTFVYDWNTVNKNGWYASPNEGVINAPINNWCMGYTVVHNHEWIYQRVQDFTNTRKWYERNMMLGNWTEWKEVEQDLSGKQDKNDNSLLTTDKTIAGAINELFQSANNGKQIIADAIGSPLTEGDTFAAMGNSINAMTIDFRNALALKGVNAPADKFEALISRIDEIVQSGNVLNNQAMVSGEYTLGDNDVIKPNSYYELYATPSKASITIANLEFTPEYYVVYIPDIDFYEQSSTASQKSIPSYLILTPDKSSVVVTGGNAYQYNQYSTTFSIQLTSNSIILNINGVTNGTANRYYSCLLKGRTIKWYAIGSSQLPNNGGERTITPSTTDQVLPDGYYSGDITVKGDSDLKPENILQGVEIFNVAGAIPSMATHTPITDYVAWNDSGVYFGIPFGAYLTPSGVGLPEVFIEKSRLDPNLIPENIVSGKSICGVAGTAPTLTTKYLLKDGGDESLYTYVNKIINYGNANVTHEDGYLKIYCSGSSYQTNTVYLNLHEQFDLTNRTAIWFDLTLSGHVSYTYFKFGVYQGTGNFTETSSTLAAGYETVYEGSIKVPFHRAKYRIDVSNCTGIHKVGIYLGAYGSYSSLLELFNIELE